MLSFAQLFTLTLLAVVGLAVPSSSGSEYNYSRFQRLPLIHRLFNTFKYTVVAQVLHSISITRLLSMAMSSNILATRALPQVFPVVVFSIGLPCATYLTAAGNPLPLLPRACVVPLVRRPFIRAMSFSYLQLGTTVCNNDAGVLPPISQDCQTIVDSILIFSASQSDIFNVTSNHMETLTFGTCSFFFENLGSTTLDYCFSSLVSCWDYFCMCLHLTWLLTEHRGFCSWSRMLPSRPAFLL